MSYNPNKLTFKVDEVTGEIIQPQVLLCDRQLNKLGEIYPVNNLRIKANLNGADEVSFSTPRQSDIYDEIKDYSVIFVRGFGYFEVSPTVSDTFIEIKNVQGSSLGETELSQLLCTLECNTEDDMKYSEGDIYIPTILYNPDSTEYSLIHRILSDSAPNYKVGYVDPTIRNCQRIFSFSKTDIISCFNQIAEEIGCIFDVVVEKNENGEVHRTVNIYDAQYCGKCGKRNIINGICQDCKSTDIRGIGDDTTIQVSTDNLSDEITLSSDGNMKNCFIVEGGDDLMTNAIEGINPSRNNKIYMFSEETMNSFSPELSERYKEYVKEYNGKKGEYAEIYETQCNISDLILYLQSGRMPSVETAERKLPEEVLHVLTQFKEYFPNGLGLSGDETKNTGSRNSAIRQIFSLFLDSGYAIKQEGGEYLPDEKYWRGSLIIYEIQNNDSKATIQIEKSCSSVNFSASNYDNSEKSENVLSNLDSLLQTFCITFSTDNYEAYIKQRIALESKNYEYLKNMDINTPKNWREYSLNRLLSYYDGYEACKLTLQELKNEAELGIDQNKK